MLCCPSLPRSWVCAAADKRRDGRVPSGRRTVGSYIAIKALRCCGCQDERLLDMDAGCAVHTIGLLYVCGSAVWLFQDFPPPPHEVGLSVMSAGLAQAPCQCSTGLSSMLTPYSPIVQPVDDQVQMDICRISLQASYLCLVLGAFSDFATAAPPFKSLVA